MQCKHAPNLRAGYARRVIRLSDAMYPTLPKNGEGILLREFGAQDAESLAAIEYDPEVKKYTLCLGVNVKNGFNVLLRDR
jgi:hypothetical protein